MPEQDPPAGATSPSPDLVAALVGGEYRVSLREQDLRAFAGNFLFENNAGHALDVVLESFEIAGERIVLCALTLRDGALLPWQRDPDGSLRQRIDKDGRLQVVVIATDSDGNSILGDAWPVPINDPMHPPT